MVSNKKKRVFITLPKYLVIELGELAKWYGKQKGVYITKSECVEILIKEKKGEIEK